MHQRGARGRQVVGVDRAPRGRRVQAPHRVSVPDHGGQGVPDQGGRELVEVEEVRPGVVDADRAVGRVGHDVRHDHRPAAADPALGSELGRERERGRLEAVAVEGADAGGAVSSVRSGRSGGCSFTPVRIRALTPVSGSCRQRSRTRVRGAPRGQVGHSCFQVPFVELDHSHGDDRNGPRERAARRPRNRPHFARPHPVTSPTSSPRYCAHPKTTSARSMN